MLIVFSVSDNLQIMEKDILNYSPIVICFVGHSVFEKKYLTKKYQHQKTFRKKLKEKKNDF